MYHRAKSVTPIWGNWSEWSWDEEQQCYYRVRQNQQGEYDYEYNVPGSDASDSHAHTPREPGMSDLAEGLHHLSTYDEPVPQERPSKSKSSKSKSHQKSQSTSEDEAAGDDTFTSIDGDSIQDGPAGQFDYTSPYYPNSTNTQYYQPSTPGSYFQQSTADHHYYQSSAHSTPYYEPSTAGGADSQAASHYTQTAATDDSASSSQETPVDDEQDEDHLFKEELAESIAASNAPYSPLGYMNEGEPLASAYGQYDDDDDEGPPTPKAPSDLNGAYMTGFEEHLEEELDPRYKVEPSSRFQPGEIFKVHWSEPQGTSTEGPPSVSGKHEIQNRFGTKFFVGFRRFIVIANDQGHCTCVPILTYGGKGCKKKGVKADKHGIIYERSHKPKLLDKEPKLGFPPVKVEMKEEGEKLSKESRVNYSKLVTVEHNIKVFFIGSVANNDFEMVSDAVNTCWQKKNHRKQRHR